MKMSMVKQAAVAVVVVAMGCMGVIALILTLVHHHSVDLPHRMQYGMVFDAGSTHTSLYMYRWPGNKENNTGVVSQMLVCDVDGNGISSYAQDPPAAGLSLRKCLDSALAFVPANQQRATPVYLGATAGMRLLQLQNQTQSDQVLEQVTKVIQGYPFDFRGARILSGMEEGAYGWITTNYLQEGFIKQHGFEGGWVHPNGRKTWGALDMGGSSTQIAFTPSQPVRDPASTLGSKLYGYQYEVYTHSYLCYGKEQTMRQLQVHLLKMSGSTRPVNHPCYHLGDNLTLTLGDLYDSPCVAKSVTFNPASVVTFTGTSEPLQCLNQIKNIMNLSACSLAPDCGFNGVYQPPVSGNFFAFSAYFYTFDFLGLAPQPTLSQATTTIDTFCKRTWDSLKKQYSVKDKYLRDYCASANYIMTVLLDGYKFNQTWGNIYFQRQVADTDIGWTLGYMLNLTNLIPSELPLVVTGVERGQWAAEVFFIVFAVFLSLMVLVLLWLWNPQDGRGNK
ncbi:ectonucleoside triphosphate diphosphohydrolase 8-like isoform X1 [Coregonus clupeaformis]|uniref:ectonucleoside triphosphate diphosphohydrolase 8-like isoform X1 n=1 Tax=Coregonus clupeaformis TaxID=59861 RepID=UPI001E1C53BC|nr:ectonucleoside triphosphate diphosphohydrolase 8-like isoform X1 [Coregonus clupeaformis]